MSTLDTTDSLEIDVVHATIYVVSAFRYAAALVSRLRISCRDLKRAKSEQSLRVKIFHESLECSQEQVAQALAVHWRELGPEFRRRDPITKNRLLQITAAIKHSVIDEIPSCSEYQSASNRHQSCDWSLILEHSLIHRRDAIAVLDDLRRRTAESIVIPPLHPSLILPRGPLLSSHASQNSQTPPPPPATSHGRSQMSSVPPSIPSTASITTTQPFRPSSSLQPHTSTMIDSNPANSSPRSTPSPSSFISLFRQKFSSSLRRHSNSPTTISSFPNNSSKSAPLSTSIANHNADPVSWRSSCLAPSLTSLASFDQLPSAKFSNLLTPLPSITESTSSSHPMLINLDSDPDNHPNSDSLLNPNLDQLVASTVDISSTPSLASSSSSPPSSNASDSAASSSTNSSLLTPFSLDPCDLDYDLHTSLKRSRSLSAVLAASPPLPHLSSPSSLTSLTSFPYISAPAPNVPTVSTQNPFKSYRSLRRPVSQRDSYSHPSHGRRTFSHLRYLFSTLPSLSQPTISLPPPPSTARSAITIPEHASSLTYTSGLLHLPLEFSWSASS